MANQLSAVVTADIRQFTRAMNTVGLSSAAASMAAIAAFAAVTKAVFDMNDAVLDAGKEYESLGLAMKFASENSAEAAKEFERIVKFADRTPFETDQLVRYSIQLKNVTSGLFGTAENIELMAGALAKAQLLGKDKAFINSLGRIISAFQTGSGQIKRYTQTLLNTGAISAKTAIAIKDLSKSGGTASDAIALLTSEFEKSRGAALEFAMTAEGLESTLKSRFKFSKAVLSGSEGLDNYKQVLIEINSIMQAIRSTEAFKELARSFGDLNAEILDLVKSDGFKRFLLEAIQWVTKLVNAVSALVKLLNISLSIKNFGKNLLPSVDIPRVNRDVEKDLARMAAAQGKQEREYLKDISNKTGVSANAFDPEKRISGER